MSRKNFTPEKAGGASGSTESALPGLGMGHHHEDGVKNTPHPPQRSLWSRREALSIMGKAAVASALGGAGALTKAVAAKRRPKVVVLGIDGMDPKLLSAYVAQGKMPNAQRLMERGGFRELRTSIPPQSPVAWADFITGMNPGGHGIFDFVHREPETFTPFLSTSKTIPPERTLTLGEWVVPLSSGKVKLLRGGKAFWNTLEAHGVGSTIFRIPSNFPPEESEARTLSGLGTPDLLGTYGTFSYYTDAPPPGAEPLGGGKVYPVEVRDHKVEACLIGPHNSFRKASPAARAEFTVWIDPVNQVAKISLQNQELILKQGEWSPWLTVEFPLVPYLEKVSGICRMYLKETHPQFKLYVSPINLNPLDPALPISTPAGYSRELAQELGLFYTQGIAEDTKALSHNILTDREYLQQAFSVLAGHEKAFDYELGRFQEGFFFFYFSSLDLNSHMFWRTIDPRHPLYSAALEKEFGWVIPHLYQKMDEVIGKTMQRIDPDTTLLVMSDHGFISFRRGFNLNTWLLHRGYAVLDDPLAQEDTDFFNTVNWSRTKVYGLGINGLYLNLEGREAHGCVRPGAEADALVNELAARLTALEDPLTGEKVISRVYNSKEVYQGPYVAQAPDLVLGYNRNYRASWETILGKYPREELVDNGDKWSGDHCMDRDLIPGVLLCSKAPEAVAPALSDLAPTILNEFGIPKPAAMIGTSLWGGKP